MSTAQSTATYAGHIDKALDVVTLDALAERIHNQCGASLKDITLSYRELTVTIHRAGLLDFLRFLRDDEQCRFKQLMDITAVDVSDLPDRQDAPRFDVVYHLLSLQHNLRVRVKINVPEGAAVPTAVKVFSSANWYEREVYDMFGIPFDGHPDLRRILTDYDFDGFPLRKDFPVEGRVEVYYDEQEQRVAYKPVDLPQQWREFATDQQWAGMTTNRHLAEQDSVFDEDEFNETKGEAK